MAYATAFHDKDVDATKVTVFAHKAQLLYLSVDNGANGAPTYVQLFDALAADVTVGTTTPTHAFEVPASGARDWVFANREMEFDTGLVIACTTTASGSTSPTTAVPVNARYH